MGSLPPNFSLKISDIEYIDYVIQYVGNSSNDWFTIKKEIINCYPRKERTKFSRRHYSTKLFFVNDFEREIMKYWKEKTGIELFIDEKKLHPTSWKRNPRGWGLLIYNETRKKKKSKTKKSSRAAD